MIAAHDQPLLYQDQLDLLRAALDPGALRAMLAQLPAAAADSLAAITAALAAGDLDGARKAAHVLKGSCSSLGAARLAEIARDIELDRATTAEMAACLPLLSETIEATADALSRVVERA